MESVLVRFQVSTAVSMKMAVFWDIASPNLVEVDQSFMGAFCLDLIMEAVCASEISVDWYKSTWRSIPEGFYFLTLASFSEVYNSTY
jgi:hypothetical protein